MKIMITGGNGFLGKHLIDRLTNLGYDDIYSVSSRAYDLRDQDHINALFKTCMPDIIFHLAADVGGIKYNLNNSGSIYYNNVMMNTQLIQKARQVKVRKFIFVSSVCAYPFDTPIPIKEECLFQGRIEPSNESYGTSKLIALLQLRAYREQYGFNFAYPILANLYGPGDSGFEYPAKAHLIPNLVKQFSTSKKAITMKGNGSLTRDLLYVEDAADALVKFVDADYGEPVNIATGREVSVREITSILAKLADRNVQVKWPDNLDRGEQRRCYDTLRAKQILEWEASTDIEEGLKRTVRWYKSL